MITMKNREHGSGALLGPIPAARRRISPVQLTFQGTSVPSGGSDFVARGREVSGDLNVRQIELAKRSGVPAPTNEGPLSGIPAWRPPVL
jgi:hypothetical protein